MFKIIRDGDGARKRNKEANKSSSRAMNSLGIVCCSFSFFLLAKNQQKLNRKRENSQGKQKAMRKINFLISCTHALFNFQRKEEAEECMLFNVVIMSMYVIEWEAWIAKHRITYRALEINRKRISFIFFLSHLFCLDVGKSSEKYKQTMLSRVTLITVMNFSFTYSFINLIHRSFTCLSNKPSVPYDAEFYFLQFTLKLQLRWNFVNNTKTTLERRVPFHIQFRGCNENKSAESWEWQNAGDGWQSRVDTMGETRESEFYSLSNDAPKY